MEEAVCGLQIFKSFLPGFLKNIVEISHNVTFSKAENIFTIKSLYLPLGGENMTPSEMRKVAINLNKKYHEFQ